MGSDDALRTVFDLRIISIAVVIALLVGAGAGYMVGNSPVSSHSAGLSSLMEERDQLEAERDSLYLDLQNLEADLDSTQELLVEEQRDVALLEQRWMEILFIDEENQVLTQQVIDLEAEIDSLQDYIEYFEGEYEELHDAYMELEEEIASLQNSYDILQEEYELLIGEESYGDAALGEIGGLHYVVWDFDRDTFQDLNITIRIYDEPSFQDGLYFQMYQGFINDVGFYFGIQTDVFRPNVGSTGKGLIFSRWETRNLSNARPAEDGWTESSGYEGDFISIRKSYDWTNHTYKLRITKVDTDDVGDWYGVWINDLDTGDVDYLGSISFPKVESERTGIRNNGISWTELYYKTKRETPIPSWHVSIKEITIDEGKSSLHATSYYSTIQNTDIYYDEEGEIHFIMGYDVEREHSPGLLY